jgi:predicted nucleotidyltransferase
MDRETTITTLQAHQSELQKLGVQALYLFGSTARNEARENADIDLFFDYQKGKFSLIDLIDVRETTTRILGRPADITTRDSLHKTLRENIEAASIRIF